MCENAQWNECMSNQKEKEGIKITQIKKRKMKHDKMLFVDHPERWAYECYALFPLFSHSSEWHTIDMDYH